MKKLFTLLLLVSVCLTSWARFEVSWDNNSKVLTVGYYLTALNGNPEPNPPSFTNEWDKLLNKPELQSAKGNVQKLVLKGEGFTNSDFTADGKMEAFINLCCGNGNTLYLDLTECTGIVSKLEYIGTASTPDYATKDFKYVYSASTAPKTVTKGTFWVEDDGNVFVPGEGMPEIKTEVNGDVTKYYYSQLFERGALFTNSGNYVLRIEDGTYYYHEFYDGSNGTPSPYSGNYQAAPNNDLPDLPYDDNGYYFMQYFNGTQSVTDLSQYQHDEGGYYNSQSYYRDIDGKKVEDWELNQYQQENGIYYKIVTWDIENDCEYNGTFYEEGGKYYYNTYFNETTQTTLDDQATTNLNNGNGEYAGKKEIRENGVLVGYELTNGTIIRIVKHEVTPNVRVTLTLRKNYLEEKKYYLEERKYYLEERITYLEEQEHWYYTENGNTIFVNESDVTPDSPNATTGTVNVASSAAALTFNKIGSYLNGVSFPNHANFTAIPDELCMAQYCPNLANVILGENVEWIGNKAFFQLRNLENVTYTVATVNGETTTYSGYDTTTGHVTFPAEMKAIGIDAFRGCYKFENVNLNLAKLVRLDAAAFNMEDPTKNNLATVTLPTSSPNRTLKFWGNQVFSSTHITKLDLENLYAIEHFAYDGYNSMGETPIGVGNIAATATFTWMTYLEELILPKNLLYAPGGNDKNSGMCSNCTSLTKVVFTGVPEFDGCEITNKVIIGEYCFRDLPLTDIQLSDNVSEIYQRAFDELSALVKVEIPASVEELQNYAFNHCSNLTTIVFKDTPESFPEGCDGPVTNVRGNSGAGAFYNCQAITDVYINREEPALHCENYGFDFYITWGHGDPTRALATLHVPKSHLADYVNLKHYLTDVIVADPGLFHDWLMEHVQQAVVPNKNGWYEFINAGPIIPDNGPDAQEIVLRTFSDWQYSYLVPNGLRAYVVNSLDFEDGNYIVTLQRLRVIPANTGVILYGHPNGKTQSGKPAISMTPVTFAKAGDIVTVDGVQVELEEDQGQPLCRANWYKLKGDDLRYKNFLEPTSTPTAEDLALIDQEKEPELYAKIQKLIQDHAVDWKNGGKYLKAFENTDEFNDPLRTKPSKPVAYRNFGLGRYSDTENLSKKVALTEDANNYVGFFRLINGWYKNGQAYLHIKGAFNEDGTVVENPEYNETHGAEILVRKDEPQFNQTKDILPYFYEYDLTDGKPFNARGNASKNPKGWWDPLHTPVAFDWVEPSLSWGDRSIQFGNSTSTVLYNGELEEDADGVVKLVIPAGAISDGEYYTLQGVKISNPTKGIYIRNGKKVIIK